ncbi:MAG: transcription termination/antitermination factor NusG [Bacteroidaceae bacterium]|nr:transcription termination/antitermination factor NusG [Bacteroidaceae bacterium]
MVEMKWYVLRAITGKETKVKEYIDAAVNNDVFAGRVGQTLVPMEKVVQVRNGKRVVTDHVLFSGYVYVQAATVTTDKEVSTPQGKVTKPVTTIVGDIAYRLRNIPNVIGILGGMDHPAPVRQAEIDRLLGAAKQQDIDVEASVSFLAGEQVKVTEGPFSTFNGVVSEVNNERKKLTVLVKVFGRETALNLGFGQVEKI